MKPLSAPASAMGAANSPPAAGNQGETAPAGNQGETAPAGAMHLAGGSHADLPAGTGMQFLSGSGTGGLQVAFVDLTATADPAGGASVAGGAADGPAFGVALGHGGLPVDFATGASRGVPGGAMRPDVAGPGHGAALPDVARHPLRVPLRFGF